MATNCGCIDTLYKFVIDLIVVSALKYTVQCKEGYAHVKHEWY